MKKTISSIIAVILTVFGLASVATLSPVYADTSSGAKVVCPDGKEANSLQDCQTGYNNINNKNASPMAVTQNIINWIMGIIGIIAVVMVIVGGLMYTTSQGEASKVKKAKDTILFGIVGIVIALLSFAIVNLVLVNIIK